MQNRRKNVIFVDFFDTLMFRRVHPLNIIGRWAALLGRKMEVPAADLLRWRREGGGAAADFNRHIYTHIPHPGMDEAEFTQLSADIECAVEIGAQYPNRRRVGWLEKRKSEGCKIYIVSDFHLGEGCFERFLMAGHIDRGLFDGIFVSCDEGRSKQRGDLYSHVLREVGAQPSEVLMVGDNPHADGTMARAAGLNSLVRRNLLHKLPYQLSHRLHINLNSTRRLRRKCYRHGSPFVEYALLFQTATARLHTALTSNGTKHVTFLSREGWYLKLLFDNHQRLFVPRSEMVQSQYMLCSRRLAQSLQPDLVGKLSTQRISIQDFLKAFGFNASQARDIACRFGISEEGLHRHDTPLSDNPEWQRLLDNLGFNEMLQKRLGEIASAGHQYLRTYVHDGHLTVVDIGWAGSMQVRMSEALDMEVQGYYLGLHNSTYDDGRHHPLLFALCPQLGMYSPYCHLLRTNIQLYEELAAAPHGSALGYWFDSNGKPMVQLEWADNERHMYEHTICHTQEEMTLLCQAIEAWRSQNPGRKLTRLCAKTVLRSALLANGERLRFLTELDNGFFWNASHEVKGTSYNPKRVNISPRIITHPDEYMRFLAKLQRTLNKKSQWLLRTYNAIIPLIYAYIWLITSVRETKRRQPFRQTTSPRTTCLDAKPLP